MPKIISKKVLLYEPIVREKNEKSFTFKQLNQVSFNIN